MLKTIQKSDFWIVHSICVMQCKRQLADGQHRLDCAVFWDVG